MLKAVQIKSESNNGKSDSLASKLNEIQEMQVPHFKNHQNFEIKLP